MPKTEEILNGLQGIVNNYPLIAILWHGVLFAFIIALIARWVPSGKLLILLMCLPALSVAILAFITGNPFNGMLFSILAILLLISGLRASDQPVETSKFVFMVFGIMMIIFGLIYPHFVSGGSIARYLYASPVGLIPCPTLSLLIGFMLLFGGFGSQAASLTLIIFGMFYGLFGTLKLGVSIDIFLILGSISLLVKYIMTLRGSV